LQALTELVRNIIVIILVTTFLDLLLPSSKMQRFVKVIMGLFILVSVLTPVLSLLAKDKDFAVFSWYQEGQQGGYTTVLQDSSQLTAVNQELFLQNYGLRIEKQMEALVGLVKGVTEAKVTVRLQEGKQAGTLEGIKAVQVVVANQPVPEAATGSSLIEPIRIEISEDSGSLAKKSEKEPRAAESSQEEIIAEEVKKTLSQYFGLEAQRIKVLFE